MKEHAFREGLRDAIPTALGYASIGLACGVVSVDKEVEVPKKAGAFLVMECENLFHFMVDRARGGHFSLRKNRLFF